MSFKNYADTILVLIYLCFSINTLSSLAGDTISANQTLSGKQTIFSSGGNFELGFFTPGKSSKYYIGIWYKKVTEQTVIWVANRETPTSDINSAQLKIVDGNLLLLNESRIKIWSTDLKSNDTVFTVLLDNGNLVLRQGLGSNSSFSSPSLWESFDNPSHSWMPGAKLGYNKRTQKKHRLFSWKNSEDPAPGLFSLELDQERRQYVVRWNLSKQYWTTGPWDGEVFSQVPELRVAHILGYIDNENESYCIYTLSDPSVMSREIIDVSGQMRQSMWSGSSWTLFWSQPSQCEVYAYCGAFATCNQNTLPVCKCLPGFKYKSDNDWSLKDYSSGCVREDVLQCEKSKSSKDKFKMNSNMSLPVYSQMLTVGSIGECESACLSKCTCTAYAYDERGCSLWHGELLNLKQVSEGNSSGRSFYVRLSANSTVFSATKNDKGVIIGAVVGSFAVVLAILAALWRCQRGMVGSWKVAEGSLVAFEYKDLQVATKKFSDKLGGGGFGSVYKGILPDSTVIAVKKLESIDQGEKQFRTEVSTIGTIQHVNLVRLLGFCPESKNKLLVYDYMKNGSLDSHLFSAKESKVLDWKTRFQIALGIARGLAYLHERCRDCIIHCDIKPENILLDAELCPKVGDFGLAKLVGRDFSRVLTTIRGTRGYLAPEWISGVAITTKADVYSYGMMMFELVSGRRNSEFLEDDEGIFFPCRAARMVIDGGDILDLLDPILNKDADVEQ